MKFFSSKRGVAALAALLLVLFLFRPGVHELRNLIATSIGSALGRRVSLDDVHLRLLPRPGFDLEGLVIYDDPAFSAEPMIRAQEVSAAIRFRSLLRGRIEIATLSANEPSINLVRKDNDSDQGRWNLASLLERNAQIPAAPTSKPASERRPAFPYLEASNARINFKIGQTKKSYALMDADVALWQDSENSWGARIKAAPVRTDFNLTDTGVLQINATWQRAASLRSTPLQLSVQWQKGQLGQITKLLSGKDRGWRGGVNFTANASGTPEALRIQSDTTIDDFRRYDIVDSEHLRLATGCSGQYNAVTSTLPDLLCESPVNGGTLRLSGTLSLMAQAANQLPNYDLTLEAKQVPLTSAVRLLRQAKKQIPSDLIAAGLLNAEFRVTRNVPSVRDDGSFTKWVGSGAAINVRLLSNSGKDEAVLGTIPLTLVPAAIVDADSHRGRPAYPRTQTKEDKEPEPAETYLRIGPAALAVNASAPLNAGGWISPSGYRFFLRGDVELRNLFRVENMLGLPVTRPAAEGSAKLDMSVSGPWQGFAVPATLGTAQLRNVRAEMHGLNEPIEIGSAALSLDQDVVKMEKISARIGNTRWSGGVTTPRHCLAPGAPLNTGLSAAPPCVFQFDLTADQVSTGDLVEWFALHPAKRPWYRILSSNSPQGTSPLLLIRAQGSLHVSRFALKEVFATQLATNLELDRGRITLKALRAQLLQGTHQGNWIIDTANYDSANPDAGHGASTADAAAQPAHFLRYHGTGTLRDISLDQVGTLMNDAWITGTANGSFDISGSGDSFRDLLTRSDGKLQFVMRNGSLPHIEIPGAPVPLPVHRFSGDLRLTKGAWELSAGRLESRDGLYQVSGTVSSDSNFDFVLKRGDELSWTVTGTLADPQVTPVDQTEAKRAEAEERTVKP